jgi:uncharacterized protein YebE (UPF0316 family)
MNPEAILLLRSAALIFGMRVVDVSLATVRTLMVMRGRKLPAWILGFFQALVFVVVIQAILSDISNWLNVVGYAAGFATGSVVGMLIEGRLAIGYTHLTIVSSRQGPAILEGLRQKGFGVTEIPARGRDGMVTMLSCSVLRRHGKQVHSLVQQVDPDAFITAVEMRLLQHGFWGS